MHHRFTLKQRMDRLMEAVEIIHSHPQGNFQERVLSACQRLSPESCNSYEFWDRRTGSHQGSLNVPYDPKDIQERFARIGELVPIQNPCFPHIMAGLSAPLRLSDLTSLRQFRQTEFHEVAFAPVELRHQVAMPFQTETHLSGITFNKGGQKDYTQEDMKMIHMLGRHTALAHQTHLVLDEAKKQKPQVEAADHTVLRRVGLSRREAEVLHWIAQGKRDREIAMILSISYRTVTNHVRAILTKLKVDTRTAAAMALSRLKNE